jgi:TP901 family phage tail tape measure protein
VAASANTVKVTFLGDAKNLTQAAAGAQGALTKFGKLAKVAMLATGAAAVAGVGYSVKAFADFDDSMTKSLAIMGDVSGAMRKEMSDAARQVGKTTKFSAKEAADSYFFLASAGMDAKTSIAALPQVAKFAQAGMFDMALATDLATDAQSALGLASKDPAKNLANLTRVTDVFVKANTLANTSVEQISEAMTNKAGAAMRSVGMDIEAGSAVLAAFADQGVKGAEAGTQFAIVLRDLQTKALSNSKEFKKFGVEVFDAKGEMRNMADIVGDLESALDGQSDAQKKTTLATMGFSDKSMGALQTLLGTSDAIRRYEKDLRSAGGITDEVAQKQMQSFKEQLGLLKSRLSDVAIEIGSKVVPMLLKLIVWLEKVWKDHGPKVTAAFAVVRDAMVVLADKVKSGADKIRDNWDAIRSAAESTATVLSPIFVALALHWAAVATAATVSAATQAAAWVVTKVQAGLSAIAHGVAIATMVAGWVLLGTQALINGAKVAAGWLLALGPIGLAIIALAAIAAAFVVAWKKSETFRDIVKGAFALVLKGVDLFLAGIQRMLEALGKIPGFGWADTAAKKVAGARNAVKGLADNINGLKDKTVNVTTVQTTIQRTVREGQQAAGKGLQARAHGGRVVPGQQYLVGEREPEMFVADQPGRIYNGRQMSQVPGGGNNYHLTVSGTLDASVNERTIQETFRRMELLAGTGG